MGKSFKRNDDLMIDSSAIAIDSDGTSLQDGVKYKIYNSVEDLGLVSGSATIASAMAAMSAPSILIAPGDDFASSQVPTQLGTVEIVKLNNGSTRGWIYFYGKDRGVGDYRMGLVNDGGPCGVWTGAIDYVKVVTSTASRTVSVPADSGLNVTGGGYVTEPAIPAGYVEVMRWGSAVGASQVVSVGPGTFWIQNTSGVARTVTCQASKLCVRRTF